MPKAKIKKRKEKTVSVDKNELKELKECKAIVEEAEKQIDGAPAGNVKDDDYTYFAQLMINFYETTGEINYLNDTKKIVQQTWDLFYDKENKIHLHRTCGDGEYPVGHE